MSKKKKRKQLSLEMLVNILSLTAAILTCIPELIKALSYENRAG